MSDVASSTWSRSDCRCHSGQSAGSTCIPTTTTPFPPSRCELAETFAGYAGVALANAALYHSTLTYAEDMTAAMRSRAVIEQAKGIVMAQQHCSSEEAFATLTRVSQNQNKKLRDLAEQIVHAVQSSK